jgi:cytochrome c oxidase assembly factor 6
MEYQRNKTLERLKAEGAQEMPGQIGPPVPGQRP